MHNITGKFLQQLPSLRLFPLNISHEGLAELVGASRQQVTTYLNEFDRDRIIARERHRIIIGPQRLKHVES